MMDHIPLKPDRHAQLVEFARQHGKDPTVALDEALADYLERKRLDFEDCVESVQRGHDDVKAGRTRPAVAVLADLREKLGISR